MGIVGNIASQLTADAADGSQSIGVRYRRAVSELAMAKLPAKLDRLHADMLRQEQLLCRIAAGQEELLGILRELRPARRDQLER